MITKHNILTISALLAASAASAVITIDTVSVQNAAGPSGNAVDSTGFGAVAYDYKIGTYEVTNDQYAEFLNDVAATDSHGLYNTQMATTGITRSGSSGSYTYTATDPNKPVDYVSFWDAARFVNYLSTTNTENGVYALGGTTAPANGSVTRDATAFANGGWAIANVNEWYKAAYYGGSATGADGDGYWAHATQSNSISTADANYSGSVGATTDVGTYSTDSSFYGTFDQAGNVGEWTESIDGTGRVVRGGNYFYPDAFISAAGGAETVGPTTESNVTGFRVVQVPEPSTYAALVGGLCLLIAIRRRRS